MDLYTTKDKTFTFLENILVVNDFEEVYWIAETACAVADSRSEREIYRLLEDSARMMKYIRNADAATQLDLFLKTIGGNYQKETGNLIQNEKILTNKEADQTKSFEDSLNSIKPHSKEIYLSEPSQESSSGQ